MNVCAYLTVPLIEALLSVSLDTYRCIHMYVASGIVVVPYHCGRLILTKWC